MSDVIQYAIVFLVIAGCVLYIGRTLWKSWAAKESGSCHGGCGCEASKSAAKTKSARVP